MSEFFVLTQRMKSTSQLSLRAPYLIFLSTRLKWVLKQKFYITGPRNCLGCGRSKNFDSPSEIELRRPSSHWQICCVIIIITERTKLGSKRLVRFVSLKSHARKATTLGNSFHARALAVAVPRNCRK